MGQTFNFLLHQTRGGSPDVQVKQPHTNKQTDLLNHNKESNTIIK
jgi:hypothetical protein